MKIAIFSDIHSNNLVLKEILHKLKDEDINEYIFSGDYITDGFEDNEILSLIRSITSNIIAGNREVAIASYSDNSWENIKQLKSMLYSFRNMTEENKEYLKSLPISKLVNINGKKISISHGSPYNTRDAVWKDSYDVFDQLINEYDADIYITGHTHRAFDTTYKGKAFINSGAVSGPISGEPVATYGVLEIDGEDIKYSPRIYKYDYNAVKEYYLNSKYHQECQEWSNLLIYTLRDGFSYSCDFIKYLNQITNEDQVENSKLWDEKFKEYCKLNKLKILR